MNVLFTNKHNLMIWNAQVFCAVNQRFMRDLSGAVFVRRKIGTS
nr:MAG TPA: hypothetical protein [Caudoviricetes sp.]